jgi:Icc-related predicted phosphoesterase
MEDSSINVVDAIGDVFAVEGEAGQKVFELISEALEAQKNVIVSFQNVEMLTAAFLTTAIGQLYKNFSESEIKSHLKVSYISDSGKVALKRVVDTAKLYYRDPEAMEKSINSILEDC